MLEQSLDDVLEKIDGFCERKYDSSHFRKLLTIVPGFYVFKQETVDGVEKTKVDIPTSFREITSCWN